MTLNENPGEQNEENNKQQKQDFDINHFEKSIEEYVE
jgi:hypothetical protein